MIGVTGNRQKQTGSRSPNELFAPLAERGAAMAQGAAGTGKPFPIHRIARTAAVDSMEVRQRYPCDGSTPLLVQTLGSSFDKRLVFITPL